MQVKAAADGGLAIGSWKLENQTVVKPADSEFKTNATAVWKEGNATVKPTSLNAGVWYTASASDNTSHAAGTPETGTKYKAVTGAELLGHYQHTKWDIKSLDATANTTYTLKVVGITVDRSAITDNGEALDKALRVAICVGGTNWFVFAPLAEDETGTVDGKFYHTVSTTANAEDTALNVGTMAKDQNDALTGETVYDVAIYNSLDLNRVTVDVYVYYEGEDANCKTSNIATNVDTLKVTIAYSAVKNNTQQGG
jgi:hypothetical protein